MTRNIYRITGTCEPPTREAIRQARKRQLEALYEIRSRILENQARRVGARAK